MHSEAFIFGAVNVCSNHFLHTHLDCLSVSSILPFFCPCVDLWESTTRKKFYSKCQQITALWWAGFVKTIKKHLLAPLKLYSFRKQLVLLNALFLIYIQAHTSRTQWSLSRGEDCSAYFEFTGTIACIWAPWLHCAHMTFQYLRRQLKHLRLWSMKSSYCVYRVKKKSQKEALLWDNGLSAMHIQKLEFPMDD